jgi:hypothetical protein
MLWNREGEGGPLAPLAPEGARDNIDPLKGRFCPRAGPDSGLRTPRAARGRGAVRLHGGDHAVRSCRFIFSSEAVWRRLYGGAKDVIISLAWGDNAVRSCGSCRAAKGPGTGAATFPTRRVPYLDIWRGPKVSSTGCKGVLWDPPGSLELAKGKLTGLTLGQP